MAILDRFVDIIKANISPVTQKEGPAPETRETSLVSERAKDRIICSKCKKPYTLNEFNPPKVEGVCDDCGAPLVKREDDEESIVRKRLAQYNEQTPAILEILIGAGAEYHRIDNNAPSAADSFEKVMKMY